MLPTMRYKLYILIQICWSIAPIYGAYKDFVIQDEKDLERFGAQDTEMYDDDAGYDLLSTWNYGDDAGGGGGSCDAVDTYDQYDSYAAEYGEDVGEYECLYNGQIDGNILQEVIQQMKNDPRFEHLHEHLNEGNFILEHKRQEVDKKLSHRYVDVDEQNFVPDEYE